MSVRLENNEIVIDGFELGIGDSPFSGPANLRAVDISSTPGEAAVNYKTSALTTPPTVSAVAYTTDTTADTVAVASTTGYYDGMAITLNTVVTSTGISTGRVYWIGNLSGLTFKLYKNPSLHASSVVDITGSNGSGTLSSYTLGKPVDSCIDPIYNYFFVIDANRRVWWVAYGADGNPTSYLAYIGNDTLTGSTGIGITTFKGYLIVLRAANSDALSLNLLESSTDLDSASGWVYDWNTISDSGRERRPILVGQDDIMYYANGSNRLGSISENVGTTFDPSSSATYTENTTALDLPNSVNVTALGELGQDLLIGTEINKIYQWDRVSPSFRIPLDIPENFTWRIETANNIAYIFAGYRGYIYVTSGSSVSEFKKIPDHLAGSFKPYFVFQDTEIDRNMLYFSVITAGNDGDSPENQLTGVWAINLKNGALHHVNYASRQSTETAPVTVIARYTLDHTSGYAPGQGIFLGWWSQTGPTYGVDQGSSLPYSNYETVIESEIIPLGSHILKTTPGQIEFKLSKPLISGEAVRLSYRTNLKASYTTLETFSTAGILSGVKDATFENVEWLQIKAELSSTDTTPSHVRLIQFRIR